MFSSVLARGSASDGRLKNNTDGSGGNEYSVKSMQYASSDLHFCSGLEYFRMFFCAMASSSGANSIPMILLKGKLDANRRARPLPDQ